MKKVISLVVFVILLAWTWNLIHRDPTISFETHSIIQQKLAKIIQASVQKHRPAAKDFNLVRLWTETISPEKVSAHFTYQFNEGENDKSAQQTVTGEALLNKTTSEENSQENWKVEKVKTSANQIIFQEGEAIDPSKEAPAEN